MASWESPMSTVGMETLVLEIFPRVEPPGISLLFVKVCVGTFARRQRSRKKAAENSIKKAWGKRAVYKGTDESFGYISHYAKGNPSESMIDDITWNDLGMDEVFKCINNTNSSVGQEYLYKMLREPVADAEKLHELDRLADEFTANEKERITIQKIFMNMGKSRKIAVTDYIGYIMDIEQGSNIVHYLAWVFLIASILVTVLVTPVLGIWLIIASVAFSIITYYKYKAKIENYFKCINVIVKMASASEDICESNISFLEPECNRLKEILKSFSKVTKGSWMIESGNVDGSIGEVVLDYLRMITHMDIVKFNKMTKLITAKSEDAYNLVDTLGFIETSIAVASFRESLPFYCKPEFVENTNNLSVKEVYHPLIDNPVCNSITTKGNVLLTGSNASGKSTFLKTIAINSILAQTIGTSLSKEYIAPVYRIYSSMALRDDLANSDSYYIVEIKSLKRILDAVGKKGRTVLCFIDEVLRGTNTVERIAASSEILKNLNTGRALCFAATHDIELTTILKDCYSNYHFQEEVTEDEVKFDYKLYAGPATTRNAIKLLNVIGYDKNIIKGAEQRAMHFLTDGNWKS